MADLEFGSEDVETLARKLDEVAGNLSDRDQAMMLAVFQLAGDQLAATTGELELEVGRRKPYARSFKIASVRDLPSLSDGFRNSFQSGGAPDLGAAVEWDVTVGVMGGW